MALRLVSSGLFDIIQFPFTVIKEETANEFVPLAAALGQGIIVMKPFGGGVLTMLPWRSTSFHQETVFSAVAVSICRLTCAA